ncbi:MAG TPA: argininosuccinate lyase [Rhodospirillales bacterium]|nr:argininosuccinate lyase [Rhodospirillales bacterium]HIL76694.1 argininosuccinate lyase [Rhodospirillales bacterium]
MKNKRQKKTSSSPIWGGRFDGSPSEIMEHINASIDFDKRMYAQDITASKAHAAMLVKQEIISAEDGTQIREGLDQILNEIEDGSFEFKISLEDIHMNIESRLKEIVGDAAGRLHTARSRNDQVATDFKLWVREELDHLDSALKLLQETFINQAENHASTILPGFTHLQSAQPVTLGHHLLSYVEMIGRDRGRIKDCRRRLNENPLGSGALAGTSFPIDRDVTTTALGFDQPTTNSLDAVSDRDFALEYLSLASILSVHLSRLAEEIVVWASAPFSFINLPDSFSTGSSMLPQKRNPDAAELIRAKTGRVIGNLASLLIIMKGLPLAYSKDMQEDKEPVFETADTLALTVKAMTGMFGEITYNIDKMLAAAKNANSNAIDLADWLVKVLGKPFREAHSISGKMVKLAEKQNRSLDELSLADMQSIEPSITNDVFNILNIDIALNARNSFGATAPKNVTKACAKARLKYLK